MRTDIPIDINLNVSEDTVPESITTLNMARFAVTMTYFLKYPALWLWDSCIEFPTNPIFWSCQEFLVTLIRQLRYRPRSGEAIKSAFFGGFHAGEV